MSASADNPLAPFERLIGGQWQLDDSYQTFEWGVGQKMLHTKSYFVQDGQPALVSEGSWFWHPGHEAIKGHHAAVAMGIDLFTYTTHFEGERMVNTLKTYAEDGSATKYLEIWEFTGPNSYEWSLYPEAGESEEKVMGGTFTRK